MPTKKQIAVRKKFKANIKKAKAIQKKNPGMKWKTAVKKAFKKPTNGRRRRKRK
jgi:hypothetical protein